MTTLVKRQQIMNLKTQYSGKQNNGWEVDKTTCAIIIYALNAVFLDGKYYSMKNGKELKFSNGNYMKSIRQKVGNTPLEGTGTGIIVYNYTDSEVEILLQLRQDLNQYGLLGGGLELGETYKNCAVNELLQEAAIVANPEDLELKDVYAGPKHITKYPSGDIVFHTTAAYCLNYANCKQLDMSLVDNETVALKWFKLSTLKKMLQNNREKFFPNNLPILEDVINKFFT